MRINKYIAQSGIASRRKADELVAAGNVKVNGLTLKEAGYDVVAGDVVEVNGRRIEPEDKKVYILLNKPLGYVTTVSDDKDRQTVMDLVKDVDARIFPVGRLDYNTSGMLIMTNDGDFAYRLTHPKHEMPKTYRARVAGVLSDEKCAKLRRGVDVGGYVTSNAKVQIVKGVQRSTIVDITIHEGKNRQVRKMFKAVGNNVQELARIAIGDIKLGRLAVGHYRKLTKEEVEYLKNS
ncbi:pseudouridine synthase [Emergencia sp. JLR.KK010]|uniref:pseudouridine synthase n=1 Tax=Emergencia sp. JLR.KK010 TaxID=3114296 RepID=UPI0030CD7810